MCAGDTAHACITSRNGTWPPSRAWKGASGKGSLRPSSPRAPATRGWEGPLPGLAWLDPHGAAQPIRRSVTVDLKITPPCVCGGVGAPRLSCVQSLPGGGRFPFFTHGPQSPGHTPACAPPSSQASGTRHCRSACGKLSLKGLKHAEPVSCSSCSPAVLPAHSAPGQLTPREAGDDRGGDKLPSPTRTTARAVGSSGGLPAGPHHHSETNALDTVLPGAEPGGQQVLHVASDTEGSPAPHTVRSDGKCGHAPHLEFLGPGL